MSTKIPDELKADMPQTTWGRILVATPVVMTVVATLLAGLASSEMTRAQYNRSFAAQQQPLFDPLGFLHLALGRAHDDVVALGAASPLEHRPRATCAVALVQGNSAYWAHIGDARLYHIRDGTVRVRSRDHSHVEVLLREGPGRAVPARLA